MPRPHAIERRVLIAGRSLENGLVNIWPRIEVVKGKGRKGPTFWYRIQARNGRTIATSETYTRASDANRGAGRAGRDLGLPVEPLPGRRLVAGITIAAAVASNRATVKAFNTYKPVDACR